MADLRSACRVCLQPATESVDSMRIFGDTVLTIRQLLHLYATSQYNESWLPRTVCASCIQHLENCHKFNEKYNQTHRELSIRFKHIQPKMKEINILPKAPLLINSFALKTISNLTPVLSIGPVHKSNTSNTKITSKLSNAVRPKISTTNITLKPIIANAQFFTNPKQKSEHYCHVCEMIFDSTQTLNSHNAEYHFTKMRTCSICNKSFQSTKLLETHRLSHREENIQALNAEIVKDEIETDFPHEVSIEKTFDESKIVPEGPLFEYVEENTDFGIVKKVLCRLCRCAFRNHTSYLTPSSLLSFVPSPEAQCPFRSRSYSHTPAVAQHRSVHKSNVCWRCNRGWRTRDCLLAHVRAHDSFRCVLCVHAYSSRTALHTHYRRHHDVTTIPYFCGICEDTMQYKHLSDLTEHLKLHNPISDVVVIKSIDSFDSLNVEQTADKQNDNINKQQQQQQHADIVKQIADTDFDLNEENLDKATSKNDIVAKNFTTTEDVINGTELVINLDEAVDFFDLADLQNKSYTVKVEDYFEKCERMNQDLTEDLVELNVEFEDDVETEKIGDTADIKDVELNEEVMKEAAQNEDATKIKYIANKNDYNTTVHVVKSITGTQNKDIVEDDEKTEDPNASTVHYYVVDDEDGDNLVEITAEQAQLLVNGETLQPGSNNEKEGLLTDHSIVLDAAFPPPALPPPPAPSPPPAPEATYECHLCGVTVTRKYNLMRHLAIVHELYTLCCSKCGKGFNNVALYDVHKTSECTQSRQATRRRHISRRRQPTCYVCSEKFKKQHLMLEHVESVHREQVSIDIANQRYTCMICKKTYATRSGFSYHMEKHSGYPRYSCEYCQRRFTVRTALHNHVAGQHTDRRPHLCQLCGRGFVSADHLRKHLRLTHGGRRDYLCVQCGLTFQQASHVAQHQWVHSGVKMHACKYCQGRYSSASALKKHVSRLHNAELSREMALQEESYQQRERERLSNMADAATC